MKAEEFKGGAKKKAEGERENEQEPEESFERKFARRRNERIERNTKYDRQVDKIEGQIKEARASQKGTGRSSHEGGRAGAGQDDADDRGSKDRRGEQSSPPLAKKKRKKKHGHKKKAGDKDAGEAISDSLRGEITTPRIHRDLHTRRPCTICAHLQHQVKKIN